MWSTDKEAQDLPAEQVTNLRMALAGTTNDIGTVDRQKGIVEPSESSENRQIMWWALALPVLAIAFIIGAHILNSPAATEAEMGEPRQGEPPLPEESTSSKRFPDRFPHKAFVSSIAYNKSHALAFINDQMVPEGGIVDGLTVLKIHQDAVEFEMNGERWTQKVGE